MNTHEKLDLLKKEHEVFLKFYRVEFPLSHGSNLFKKDFYCAVKRYLTYKDISTDHLEIKKLVFSFSEYLVSQNILQVVDNSTFMLNYPDFSHNTPYRKINP